MLRLLLAAGAFITAAIGEAVCGQLMCRLPHTCTRTMAAKRRSIIMDAGATAGGVSAKCRRGRWVGGVPWGRWCHAFSDSLFMSVCE